MGLGPLQRSGQVDSGALSLILFQRSNSFSDNITEVMPQSESRE